VAFRDHVWIVYVWHGFIVPSINRIGIRAWPHEIQELNKTRPRKAQKLQEKMDRLQVLS
jgi:hypothetical protein